MTAWKLAAIAALAMATAGCAGSGGRMTTGPIKYRMMACPKLDAERIKVERATNRLFLSLRRKGAFGKRDETEVLAMWPTLMFLRGDGSKDARQYNRLRSEYDTLRMVAAERPCPIAFAGDVSKTVVRGATSPTTRRINEVVEQETGGK